MARRNIEKEEETRSVLGKIVIKADFEVDLEDHVRNVHKHWLAAKNACQQMSDRQVIRHILGTLALREERIGKFLLKDLEARIPLGNPHDIEFVDFCNSFIDYWKTYLGEVISHSGSKSVVTTDDEFTQPMRNNDKE
ncbi:hypothetical protein Fot_03894 [Forsythia ovata]|uniref:Uncharacterized protein n=1 Tax=Forsythia ovata TaxID=205694 RepID=A0ABD1XB00_9LAMI